MPCGTLVKERDMSSKNLFGSAAGKALLNWPPRILDELQPEGNIMVQSKVKSPLSRFRSDSRGSVSLAFGLAAVPLFLTAAVAIDYSRAVSVKQHVQQVADAASIAAAAAPSSLTIAQRRAVALKFIAGNIASDLIETPVVNITPNTAEVKLKAIVEGQLINFSADPNNQGSTVKVSAKSKTSFGYQSYQCLLALNPSMYEAVKFWGNSEFTAQLCTVQANSNHAIAMRTGGSAYAEAEGFCARGGWAGSGFEPDPSGGCTPAADPYAALVLPAASSTCAHTNYTVRKQDGPQFITPGVYCGGINLKVDSKVTLAPGTYFIKNGGLDMNTHSEMMANDVTFILVGNSHVQIDSQSKLTLTAPTVADVTANGGGIATMAIIQKADSNPGVINTITSGGDVNIVGAYYTPKQNLTVWANGDMNTLSPYFPMVVDNFEMSGTATLHVNLDWTAAGYGEPLELKARKYLYLTE